MVRRRLFGRHVRPEIHYVRSRSDSISFRFAAMNRALLPLVVFSAALVACQQRTAANMTTSEQRAIADSLKKLVVNAYDLSKPDPVKSLMSLYPDSGRVISASGGVVTTTRPQLEQGIRAFWTYVGQNMRNPKWEWTSMNVDVLAPDAAVMTSTYRVPHQTPTGMNHVIGGAWTAVFQKRGGRWVVIQEHLSDLQSNPNLQTQDSMPGMSMPHGNP
jgi:ketosteroid isomerase-like protein